jgi:peptide/nickel transport system permease protein
MSLRVLHPVSASGRFVLARSVHAITTLAILSVLVFIDVNMLPGDIGRRILGPFADPRAVAVLDAELGTNRPLLVQYFDWLHKILTGNLGNSYAFRRPVAEMLWPALGNSAKLATLVFVIVVPLSIAGGLIAAMRRDRPLDRIISVGGLSGTAIPEFIWGIVLIVVFGLTLHWLPVTAQAPDGSGLATQVEYLLLPALCLVFVLFGHIARMTRAGTIEALDSDYTRAAVLKGLPTWTVIRRHVLRNSLLPTISVVAIHSGYLIGGLVAIEVIFNYQGIGQLIFLAAEEKDFPMLQTAVLLIGAVYLLTTLVGDLMYSILNPRIGLLRGGDD